MNMRIGAAMVAAACAVLGVERKIWKTRAVTLRPVLGVHHAAMRNAMVALRVPHLVQADLLGHHVLYDSARVEECPFFVGMVEFYTERGRAVL